MWENSKVCFLVEPWEYISWVETLIESTQHIQTLKFPADGGSVHRVIPDVDLFLCVHVIADQVSIILIFDNVIKLI